MTPLLFLTSYGLRFPTREGLQLRSWISWRKAVSTLPRTGERRLITKTLDPHVEILFARPVDIPEYVATGAADLGITGHDMVVERGSDVEELLDLQSGKAKLVLAVHEDSEITSVNQLAGLKVATEFPVITRAYFKKQKVNVEVVLVGGACEATPHLGIADAIIDLSSSGTTLKTNRLRVIDEVLETSTYLIANRESLQTKKEKIDEIHLALESVIRARGPVLPDDERKTLFP